MKKDELVSIIVPVYNTQDYLKKCIDSILNQTYQNIEIILIDDGSTDKSAEICDRYLTIDNRVKVIHQKNSGVSHARNEGLKESKGDFIAFVDSDDEIDEDFIRTLYDKFDESIDMTVCAFELVVDEQGSESRNATEDKLECIKLSREEAIETVLHGKLFAGHSCNKMFRKNVLQNIKFPEDIYVYEDMLFVVEYLLQSQNVLYVASPLYKYYIRNDSASHGTMSDKKMTAFVALSRIEKKLKLLNGERFTAKINHNRILWTMYCYRLLMYDKIHRGAYAPLLKQNLRSYAGKASLSYKVKAKVLLISICPFLYYCSGKMVDKIREYKRKVLR